MISCLRPCGVLVFSHVTGRASKTVNSVPSLIAVDSYAAPELYYYEVIECGRRMVLTGVFVFIAPRTASQAATACIFAFLSLLGFELMRPHTDPTNSWLYRLVSRVLWGILRVVQAYWYV